MIDKVFDVWKDILIKIFEPLSYYWLADIVIAILIIGGVLFVLWLIFVFPFLMMKRKNK